MTLALSRRRLYNCRSDLNWPADPEFWAQHAAEQSADGTLQARLGLQLPPPCVEPLLQL